MLPPHFSFLFLSWRKRADFPTLVQGRGEKFPFSSCKQGSLLFSLPLILLLSPLFLPFHPALLLTHKGQAGWLCLSGGVSLLTTIQYAVLEAERSRGHKGNGDERLRTESTQQKENLQQEAVVMEVEYRKGGRTRPDQTGRHTDERRPL